MAVVTPLNNPGGPEGDTVTVAEKLLNTEYRQEREPKHGLQKTSARANPSQMLKKMPIHKSVLEQGTCQKRPQHCTRYRLPRAMPKQSKGSASSILGGTLITPKIQGHQLSKRLTFGKVKTARSS